MINGELRNQIDKLWTEFWTGGIANPLMVIEPVVTETPPIRGHDPVKTVARVGYRRHA
jgi:hypothetical protein